MHVFALQDPYQPSYGTSVVSNHPPVMLHIIIATSNWKCLTSILLAAMHWATVTCLAGCMPAVQGSCGYGVLDKTKYPYWSVGALSTQNIYYLQGPVRGCG